MEPLLRSSIYSLKQDPSECLVVMSDHHISKVLKKNQSETALELLLETFDFQGAYLPQCTTLATYYANKATGAVIDCGDTVTDITCVYEHCGISKSVKAVDIAGREVTEAIQKLLPEMKEKLPGWSPIPSKETKPFAECEWTENPTVVARNIKEKYAYVSPAQASECKVEIPNKATPEITLSAEQLSCPEMLFKPSLNGLEFDGVGKAFFDSIMSCDEAVRSDMFSNIILSGGTTMLKGFAERLEAEIKGLAPSGTEVNVIALPKRHQATWLGGCVVAGMEAFPQMLISYDEYYENGAWILHRRCW